MRSFVHMKRNLTLPITFACLLFTSEASAQGCSDAGVCTAGPLGDITLVGGSGKVGWDVRNEARMMFSYAIGEQRTTILQLTPELKVNLTERLRVQARIPFMNITGNLGSTSGVGDPVVTASYAIIKPDAEGLDALLGVKLNTGKAALTDDSLRSLPMPYQTSLGTKDLLMGLNYRNRHFTVGVAYQLVVADDNSNGFTHENWQDVPEAQGYFESSGLMRADDAVARIQYAFKISRLVIQPGLLAIYHVGPDLRQITLASTPERISVDGSQGLTLNITADARYPIGDHWSLEASFGTPVITRDVRPDGLTRSMVLNAGLAYRFGK
jgi:hypothetical protein